MRAKAMQRFDGIDLLVLVAWSEFGIRIAESMDIRPSVKTALLDPIEFFGREFITEQIATVISRIQRAIAWRPVETYRVSEACSKYFLIRAVRPESYDGCPFGVCLDAFVAS